MSPLDETRQASARQRQATLPDRSVWVAASAGTGKTSVLTNRVLALLLTGTAPERLLCLTFTKAGAAEMQNRIMRRLGDWATLPEPDLIAALTDLTDRPPAPEQVVLARRLFGRVLEAPGRLKIQTIHAFCQSLLGRFPLEAQVPPGFTAMDEPTADGLLVEARNHVLMVARDHDPQLALDLALVADRSGEEGLLSLLRTLTSEREQLAQRVMLAGGVEGMIAGLARRLGVDPDQTIESAETDFWAATLGQRGALKNTADALSRGSKTDGQKAETLYHLLVHGTAEDIPLYADLWLTKEGEIRKTLATKPVLTANPALGPFLAREADRCRHHQELVAALAVLTSSAALIRLGLAVLEAYEGLKRARAWLDYNDLILKTLALLRAGTSWVLYKLDGGLDHILIDEAQDTNPEQWEVVRLLADEFFSGHGVPLTRPRTLFVVGDAKQSIFSFQRADPVKFGEMRRFFAERIEVAAQTFNQVDLLHSFRSTAAVLRAVDLVCNGPGAEGILEAGQGQIEHRVSRLGQGGRVEIWPLAVKADATEEEPWQLPQATAADDVPRRRVASLIARTIRRWIATGERLESADRAVRAGDILILVRRRGDFMAEMVRALKEAGVPVAGADRMVLTEQLAVMDLLALARFVLLPTDDLSLACLLKSSLVGLSEDQLADVAIGRGGDLWTALTDRRDDVRLGPVVARLYGWLSRADLERPYEFFTNVLGAGGGRTALLARLGEEAADPIDEFLNQCLAFERAHTPSMQGFVHWLDTSTQELKREMEAEARDEVRIMTVHGAKGLQAPIVFLPDTTDVGRMRDSLFWPEDEAGPWGPLWVSAAKGADGVSLAVRQAEEAKQQREYRRLLYVALTRAEDRLYVLGWRNRDSLTEGCWYDLIAASLMPVAEQIAMDFAGDGFPDWQGPGWRLSSPQTAAPRAAKPAPPRLPPPPLPDWIHRAPPEEPVPSRPLAPSRLEEDPPARSPLAGQGNGYRRGRLVHRLLQTLPDLPSVQREGAAHRFLASPLHGLPSEEVSALTAEVMAVLDHPDFAPLFAPGSRAEVPLAGVLGPLVIAGQVDRLAVTPDDILLIDYKTNRPPPREPDKVAPAYRKQMAAYRGLLQQLYPGRPIRCALLWTDGPFLMELPEELLDAALQEILIRR